MSDGEDESMVEEAQRARCCYRGMVDFKKQVRAKMNQALKEECGKSAFDLKVNVRKGNGKGKGELYRWCVVELLDGNGAAVCSYMLSLSGQWVDVGTWNLHEDFRHVQLFRSDDGDVNAAAGGGVENGCLSILFREEDAYPRATRYERDLESEEACKPWGLKIDPPIKQPCLDILSDSFNPEELGRFFVSLIEEDIRQRQEVGA